jgi:hypothetical protein
VAKEIFREKRFNQRSQELIEICDQIIDDYQGQGLRLTLRQLYYQCVSRNIIPNEEKSYKNLGSLVSDARLAGLLDWDAIEDRVRVPRVPLEFNSIQERVKYAIRNYRLPRWADQDTYCELWVEKDALAGVLAPIASEFHVTLMVNRGYSSQSAMYESAIRFNEHENKYRYLFYLGDHDPSGEDMVRDVDDRLRMFGVQDLNVQKIALNMDQIRRYRPPPNPAKLSDSRAQAYIAKFGTSSWEVDALPPEVLAKLIRKTLEEVVDREKMDAVIQKEETDKAKLLKLAEGI